MPALRLCLAAVLLLGGCATRPLSPNEAAFLETTHGPGLQAEQITLVKGALIGGVKLTRAARPWETCREKIYPPEDGEVTGQVAGMVLYDRILIARWFWNRDFLAGYPNELPLARAMFLAHEATHVWQWQQSQATGYAPWKAAAEHTADDPYLFTLGDREFLDYGYEQQASLVEEYVCCRALDPEGARTDKLRDLLAPHFPGLAADETAPRTRIPWSEAPVAGICS